MKVGKIILITIAVTVVVVGGTSLLLMNNMDRLARESFEEGGFELLGTQVNLDKVSITLLAGKARFSGLRIGNPEGYSSAAALNFGLIEVDIDLGSLNEDVLVIEKSSIGGSLRQRALQLLSGADDQSNDSLYGYLGVGPGLLCL